MTGAPLGESEFRKLVQETFDAVERAFRDTDPDVAECEQSHGALTISFADRSRCILSTQPSVRQIWLALAARGTAYHFSYDPARSAWIDDKGRGIELRGLLRQTLKEATGADFAL
jgi:CyaY protein